MFRKPRQQTIKDGMDLTSRVSRCAVCIRRRSPDRRPPIVLPQPPSEIYRQRFRNLEARRNQNRRVRLRHRGRPQET